MPDQHAGTTANSLIIGWVLNEENHPIAWTRPAPPNLSSRDSSEIVTVELPDLASNTCILARSGSGKSYLLGRLIEEVIFRSSVNITVFDPNADYLRVYEMAQSQPGRYDVSTAFGYLPTESDNNNFSASLERQAFEVRTARQLSTTRTNIKTTSLAVPWWYLDEGFFVDRTMPFALREAMMASHIFATSAACVWALGRMKQEGVLDNLTLRLDMDYLNLCFRQERDMLQRSLSAVEVDASSADLKSAHVAKVVEAHRIIGPEDWRAYDLRMRRLMLSGIISPEYRFYRTRPEPRVRIVDISSTSEQALVTEANLWEILHFAKSRFSQSLSPVNGLDPRVPMLVIIDEAHRLAPIEPASAEEESSRALIREILAEGRKYGIASILVTQRPDKIDPLVIGECQNLAMLGSPSPAMATRAAELCGLDDPVGNTSSRVNGLGKGRAMIFGRWSKGCPRFLYVAGRRIREGGKNVEWNIGANY